MQTEYYVSLAMLRVTSLSNVIIEQIGAVAVSPQKPLQLIGNGHQQDPLKALDVCDLLKKTYEN